MIKKVEITETYTYTINMNLEADEDVREAVYETPSLINMCEEDREKVINSKDFFAEFNYEEIE